eukprot:gene7459-3896_t
MPGVRRPAEGGRERGGRAAVRRGAAVVQAVRRVGGRRRVALALAGMRRNPAAVQRRAAAARHETGARTQDGFLGGPHSVKLHAGAGVDVLNAV